ncbi:MAG: heavy metal translocating P-type ATPase [Deltaproteobacteria bacterium]|nr:MAG: heavy metal translocating P-type ATPase [Deltaproteobacteria bacterium]
MRSKYSEKSVTVVHELEDRLRIRCSMLGNRRLDPSYLEATVENIPGVESARVNTGARSIVVEYSGKNTVRNAILTCLIDIPESLFCGDGQPKTLPSVLTLIGRGALTASLLFLPPLAAAPLALAMTIPVVAGGVITLWTRGIKVEVLDGAAVLFCLVRRDYFTAASIAFLLSAGEFLEELSENRTTGMLKSLLKPQVEKIWVQHDGQELEIPLQDAVVGDRVICGSGELIPLDGLVVEGEASVNTSSISGESVPVRVEPGVEVLSGSVVEEGRIIFEATKVGSETSMARISTFLENSLRYESQSQKKSDELADRLVPVTFGLGLGLLVITQDLQKAAAVLTVDYSCAIKLANPVAVRMAMYTAAGQGVLLKGAQAMDSLARIDTLVFDKTGTLTAGELEVTDLHGTGGFSDEELLTIAASAEEHYSHPVAAAVVRAAQKRQLDLPPTSQVDFIVAHGVSAYIDGKNVLVGSRHFIEDDEGISCAEADKVIGALHNEGKSVLYVACDEVLAGVIGLRDELRPETFTVLNTLKETGIKKIVILTGDAELTARALAAKLPAVDEVHWELKPEDKARIVKEMQSQGHKLGFIGDGVNDAPALVSAEVGICLPDGADLAKESAQVILLKDDLRSLVSARIIALRSQATINHSFVAAVGLNSIFLLLASFGIITPAVSALLHNTSTIGILGYAAARGRKKAAEPNMPESSELPEIPEGSN